MRGASTGWGSWVGSCGGFGNGLRAGVRGAGSAGTGLGGDVHHVHGVCGGVVGGCGGGVVSGADLARRVVAVHTWCGIELDGERLAGWPPVLVVADDAAEAARGDGDVCARPRAAVRGLAVAVGVVGGCGHGSRANTVQRSAGWMRGRTRPRMPSP